MWLVFLYRLDNITADENIILFLGYYYKKKKKKPLIETKYFPPTKVYFQ